MHTPLPCLGYDKFFLPPPHLSSPTPQKTMGMSPSGVRPERAQIKQLAWPMVERQIGHRKSSLVLSARFPVVNWRSRPVAKSA